VDELDGAWNRVTFTHDPLRSSMEMFVKAAVRIGYIRDQDANIARMFGLRLLNKLLKKNPAQ
jgi:hypothetical protein